MKGIIDSTLREGEQTVGISFSLALKLEIVKRLGHIGIEEIEIGIASRHDDTPAMLIRQVRSTGLSARLALWCRCNKKDIEIAAAAKPEVVSLSIPVSDLHIEKKLGKSRAWVLERAGEAIRYAVDLKIPFISLGLEDGTRADPDFLARVVRVAEKAGVRRIRLADTVGIASPAEISGLVKLLKKISAIEIGVHMHNDFGMATANSISAIDAGADWVDGTILGLGERAGNARLEELVGYLSLRRAHHYLASEVPALSRLVAEAAGREIQPHQPIIGRDIFACETGLHLQGLSKDPETYEPFGPEKTGAGRRLLYGGKVGNREVSDCLEAAGIRLPADQIEKLVSDVRTASGQLKRPLLLHEFRSLLTSSHSSI